MKLCISVIFVVLFTRTLALNSSCFVLYGASCMTCLSAPVEEDCVFCLISSAKIGLCMNGTECELLSMAYEPINSSHENNSTNSSQSNATETNSTGTYPIIGDPFSVCECPATNCSDCLAMPGCFWCPGDGACKSKTSKSDSSCVFTTEMVTSASQCNRTCGSSGVLLEAVFDIFDSCGCAKRISSNGRQCYPCSSYLNETLFDDLTPITTCAPMCVRPPTLTQIWTRTVGLPLSNCKYPPANKTVPTTTPTPTNNTSNNTMSTTGFFSTTSSTTNTSNTTMPTTGFFSTTSSTTNTTNTTTPTSSFSTTSSSTNVTVPVTNITNVTRGTTTSVLKNPSPSSTTSFMPAPLEPEPLGLAPGFPTESGSSLLMTSLAVTMIVSLWWC